MKDRKDKERAQKKRRCCSVAIALLEAYAEAYDLGEMSGGEIDAANDAIDSMTHRLAAAMPAVP